MDGSSLISAISDELLAASDFVLLVGSFAEGLATSTSDIDIYVCCQHVFKGGLYNRENLLKLGRKLEVSVISRVFIGEVMAGAAREHYDGYALREVEIIHKFINGKVLRGHSCYEEVVSPVLRAEFPMKLASYFQGYANDHYDDAVGSHQNDDPISTSLFLRSLVESAVDAWLALAGDTYPKPKWRARRAATLLPGKLYRAYLDVIFANPIGSVDVYECYVCKCLLLYRELQLRMNFDPNGLEGQVSREACRYLVSPWVFLHEMPDGLYAKVKCKQYKVNALSRLVILSLFEARSRSALLNFTQANGYQDGHLLDKALENLIALGIVHVEASAMQGNALNA